MRPMFDIAIDMATVSDPGNASIGIIGFERPSKKMYLPQTPQATAIKKLAVLITRSKSVNTKSQHPNMWHF